MSTIPIYVISLKGAQERRAFMSEQLDTLGLPFRFYDAVDGRGWDVPAHLSYDKAKRRAFFGKDLSGGEMGCLLSHRAIYEKMLREGTPEVLVLEDDAILHADLPKVLGALERMGEPYDLIRFLGSDKVAKLEQKIVAPITGQYTLNRLCTTPGGAHAYIITQAGAQKLLKHMQRNFLPVDTLMGHVWMTGIKGYIVQPGLAVHDLARESFIGDARFDKKGAGVKPWYYPLSRALFKAYEGIAKRVSYVFS